MKAKKLNDKETMLILLLVIAGLLACHIFKMSAVFIVALFALWGLKIAGLYDQIRFFKKHSFSKICIWNAAFFLWTSAFFAMFFSSNLLVSGFGQLLLAVLKSLFNTIGSAVLLFFPVVFFVWKYRKKIINIKNIFAPQAVLRLIPAVAKYPIYTPEAEVYCPEANPDFSKDKTESTTVSEPEEKKEASEYEFPNLDLLKDYPADNEQDVQKEVENKKQIIKQALNDFGISITDISATIGAAVTLYELTIARGVVSAKIKNLDEDIARYLKVEAVRIISPFKKNGTIAIEVPNEKRTFVGIKSLLSTEQFADNTHELPLALGKTIDGKAKVIDLTDMPHILVAGATKQGKSVGLNAMLTSLLYKKHPNELKLVLFDPKFLELSIYEEIKKRYFFPIPNVASPVITDDVDEIRTTLQFLYKEMTNRFLMLRNNKCRNIKEYNTPQQVNGNSGYLPYIVVVIDEFADILQDKEIEKTVISLARKARAVGIHLIIATQRPSAKTITGDITANFPARIAYRVVSDINSRIILDSGGAEKLVGDGDMLFFTNAEMTRIQGAFVDTEEVQNIVDFIANQK